MATPEKNFGEEDNSPPQKQPVKYSLKDGYEVTFVKEPPQEIQVECSICLQVLFDPCLLDCKCGYSFCRSCIEPIRDRGSPCPLCSTKFSIVLPNLRLDRILKEMDINCPHRELGCKWANEQRHLSDHLNTTPVAMNRLNGCEHTVIKCMLCPYSCKRREMANHQSLQCPERQYTCEYCQEYTSTFKDVYTHHWPSCAPFNRVCERGTISSRFGFDNVPQVVGGAGTDIVGDSAASQCMDDLLSSKEEQMQIVLKIKLPSKTNHSAVQASDNPTDSTTQHINDSTPQPEKIERQKIKGQTISAIMSNFSTYKGNTVWYSQPFYTHQQGYYMCLSVQPHKDADSKGGYVSINTHIMKGEYDKELRWPLRGEITIKLVDQVHTESGRSHSRMIRYTEDVGKDCAGRVKEEGKRSGGVGKSNFIARRSLQPNFLQNDSLWFDVHCEVVV